MSWRASTIAATTRETASVLVSGHEVILAGVIPPPPPCHSPPRDHAQCPKARGTPHFSFDMIVSLPTRRVATAAKPPDNIKLMRIENRRLALVLVTIWGEGHPRPVSDTLPSLGRTLTDSSGQPLAGKY